MTARPLSPALAAARAKAPPLSRFHARLERIGAPARAAEREALRPRVRLPRLPNRPEGGSPMTPTTDRAVTLDGSVVGSLSRNGEWTPNPAGRALGLRPTTRSWRTLAALRRDLRRQLAAARRTEAAR